jgi:hypothetical protein
MPGVMLLLTVAVALLRFGDRLLWPARHELFVYGTALAPLLERERRITSQLGRLWGDEAPDARAAQRLLEREVAPALDALQSSARELESLHPLQTEEVRALHRRYLAVLDGLQAATAAAVTTVRDPARRGPAVAREVWDELARARRLRLGFEQQARALTQRYNVQLTPSPTR